MNTLNPFTELWSPSPCAKTNMVMFVLLLNFNEAEGKVVVVVVALVSSLVGC